MRHTKNKVAGLILAAGASTRMGKTKQLLPMNRGRSLLGMIINEALKSDLNKVVLVLGHRAKEIQTVLGRVLRHSKLEVVHNRQYKQGISSSIITGLSQVESSYDYVMIILADMPHIDAKLINFFLSRYLDSRQPMGAIKIRQRRSHPVIFSRKMYHELHELRGDVGARDLFLKYRDRVCLVDPGDPYDDRDIDTPEDYLVFKNPPGKG